jgi:hypothetical protein
MMVLVALASSASSALAFNPQPDPPRRLSISESIQLPSYDSISIETGGR